MKAILLEYYKLRHKHLLIMITGFLAVEILWAFMAMSMSISRNPNTGGWEPLLLMLTSMNGLFIPILTAVCVSRICDMEHKGNTWKLLISLSVKRSKLYFAKFVCAASILFYACVLQIIAIWLFGTLNQFPQPMPYELLFRSFLGNFLTSLVIVALQQWISMAVKNQAFALCLGMAGGFIGLAADLFPTAIRRIFIWSYFTGLSPVVQTYTGDTMVFQAQTMTEVLPLMAVVTVLGVLIFWLGNMHISRKDI